MLQESKREEIKAQAKAILDNFAKALEKVKLKPKKQKEKAGGFRDEAAPEDCDEDFRKRMFANAPNKNEDFIIAEKASWL